MRSSLTCRRAAALLVSIVTITGASAYEPQSTERGQISSAQVHPFADYHLHLLSPAAIKQLETVGIMATPRDAAELVSQLDAAGVQRGVVLSTAYWFGGGVMPAPADEYASVRAENDWTMREVGRYPLRLVAFCSVNPLKEYAIAEVRRCAANSVVRGLKLHLGNSRVDLRNPDHVELLKRVFSAVNQQHLAIAIHLWNGRDYGARDAEIFLHDVLPSSPDIPIQIAHFAGGSPGYPDAALGIFADAIARGDSRAQHLYFDVAAVAINQPPDVLDALARRIRQVGVTRVLFGTDVGTPREAWDTFLSGVPLRADEVAAIATNATPYVR